MLIEKPVSGSRVIIRRKTPFTFGAYPPPEDFH